MKDGIIIINKPQWFTSFDVVAKVRKALGTKKVGHTGTLDPMATGVLIVCVGKATALVNELTCDDKVYRTTIKLGIKTDSDDLTGNIIKTYNDSLLPSYDDCKETHLSDTAKKIFDKSIVYANSLNYSFEHNNIDEVLKSFVGKQKQVPSIYSSIKINGKKLYEYARSGEHVDIPARDIEIFDIYDISFNGKDEISYTVHCSKGTYIRTLNDDIAKKLGTIGTTMVLQRVKVGDYDINQSVDISKISEDEIISIEKLFEKKIEIKKEQLNKLLNGIEINTDCTNGIYNIYCENNYVGLGKINNKKLKRFIIL